MCSHIAMSNTNIYLQIFENRIRARNIGSGQTAEMAAAEPFSHPRALLAKFTAADPLVRQAVAAVGGKKMFRTLRVLVQPMGEFVGGLTEIEERAFCELAAGAGAKKVVVWVGASLSDEAITRRLEGT